jgi:hypothetical protein
VGSVTAGWQQSGSGWRKRYPNGREAYITLNLTGWSVLIRYPGGESHYADRYYRSKASAMTAADRLGAQGLSR